jgi:Ca-activated chloride channel family protein
MEVTAKFTYSKVQFDKFNDVHLVVTLKAPKIDWQAKRPAICVIPVIDISGSMNGDKLAYAKQSVFKLIDNLQPGDFCGLITFGNSAYEIAKPAEVTQSYKDQLKAKVGALTANESTNFSAGLVMALDRLNKADLPAGMLLRAIMFTDGHANCGVVGSDALQTLLTGNLGRASVSCFGYGDGADQDLLADLSTKGKGNYAFVKNPEDALTAFAKELGGLLSTYAQNIVVDLATYGDHRFVEVLSDVDSESDKDNTVKIKIPNILSEEERHIVLAVRLGEQKTVGPRSVNAIDVQIAYDAFDADGKKVARSETAKAKVQFVKAGEEQTTPDAELDLIVSTAKLAQTQIEAEKFAKAGNFQAAQNAWANLGTYYAAHGHTSHLNASTVIGSKFVGQAQYRSSSGFLKSTGKSFSRSVGAYSSDAEANQVFASMNLNTSNAAQNAMTANFAGTASTPPPDPVAAPVAAPIAAPVVAQPAVVVKLSKKKSRRW